jgi:hypothetical protein
MSAPTRLPEPLPRSAERQSQPIATGTGSGTAEQFHHFR